MREAHEVIDLDDAKHVIESVDEVILEDDETCAAVEVNDVENGDEKEKLELL